MTEKMEIYSIAKPKKRINIGKNVDQRKEGIMQKELLSPVERLEEETRDSEMPKAGNNDVYFDMVNSHLTKHMMTKLM